MPSGLGHVFDVKCATAGTWAFRYTARMSTLLVRACCSDPVGVAVGQALVSANDGTGLSSNSSAIACGTHDLSFSFERSFVLST